MPRQPRSLLGCNNAKRTREPKAAQRPQDEIGGQDEVVSGAAEVGKHSHPEPPLLDVVPQGNGVDESFDDGAQLGIPRNDVALVK